MALKASERKKLKAALQASSRSRITDEQLEEAAALLIDGKKTVPELAEKYQISAQTLRRHLLSLAEPNGVAEAVSAE